MTEMLRTLEFGSLEEASQEARSLLDDGYLMKGKWTLGQICRHLRLVQDGSIDGYPQWLSYFAFLRPVMRRFLLPRLLTTDSPRGIPTSGPFKPGAAVDDREEVEKFCASCSRLESFQGPFHPHPGFGRQSREMILEIHCRHAAHHLRFLEPSSESASGSATNERVATVRS